MTKQMTKQINVMISQLSEWLKSLELSGHCGGHKRDDCPDCAQYWQLLVAWSAMDDLQKFVEAQGDDEVTP